MQSPHMFASAMCAVAAVQRVLCMHRERCVHASCVTPNANCVVPTILLLLLMQYDMNGHCRKGFLVSGSVSNMATLDVLLDRRNCWTQSINLQVFRDAKDIFLNQLPQVASCKQDFTVEPGAVSPVPLFEFELRELFIEATVKSGCKWWCRESRPSRADRNVSRSLWSTRFVCRHSGKEYQKHQKDNSRVSRHLIQCGCLASCKMKAISVRTITTNAVQSFSFLCCSRLIL